VEKIILRTNAIPVYGFLSYINAHREEAGSSQEKILDCGAGGPIPPAALFAEHGFDAWGIDTSDQQLEKAETFCAENKVTLHLQKGDMREIPFEDETFNYVYEHYAMCHLSKRDTAIAIDEMHRVLKSGGLCFLGAISSECFPKVSFGQEKAPGEYWGKEGKEMTPHSLFAEEDFEALLANWEILTKEKHVKYRQNMHLKPTLEDWMASHAEAGPQHTREEWQQRYESYNDEMQYVHLYYILRKP
jgi:ubiquinone/menaquinone biosynthesis C-methylase UbiE